MAEKTIWVNATWLTTEQIVRALVGAVLGIAIARHLGPEQNGVLNYAIALIACVAPMATLGLEAVTPRELLLNLAQPRRILGTACALRVLAASSVSILAAAAVWWLGPDNSEVRLVAVIVSLQVPLQIGDICDYRMQSELQNDTSAKARLTALCIAAMVRVVLLVMGASTIAFAITILIEAVLTSAALVLVYQRRYGDLLAWRPSAIHAQRFLRPALSVAMANFLFAATAQIDKLVLGYFRPIEQVGLYAVAYQLSATWYVLPVLLGTAAMPRLVQMQSDSPQQYERELIHIYSLVTGIAVIGCILVTALSRPVVTSLFGTSFAGAAPILMIHVWTGVFVFHVHVRSRAYIVENTSRIIPMIALLTAITNLLLNLWLARLYGPIGAAYASLFSWFLSATAFPLFWRQSRHSSRLFMRSLDPSSWWGALRFWSTIRM